MKKSNKKSKNNAVEAQAIVTTEATEATTTEATEAITTEATEAITTEATEAITTEATEATTTEATEAVTTEATEATTTEATEATSKKEDKKKSTLKQSRWVKVHEQGQGNFEVKDNVMDITIGENSYQAEITYKTSLVRNFNKAVYWFLRGLTNARAEVVAQLATDALTTQAANASKETDEIAASGNGWNCTVVSMGEGVFKATMRWTNEATGQTEN